MLENTDYNKNVLRLLRFLSRENETSYLFAIADDQRQIPSINQEMAALLAKKDKKTTLLFLDVFSDSSILQQMRLKIAADDAQVLIVPNLHECILHEKKGDTFLTELNFSREALHNLPVTKLFWINTAALTVLQNQAVDLYQQRALTTTHFTKNDQADAVLNNIETDLARLAPERSVEKKEKNTRIHFLKNQWEEAKTSALAPLRIATSYALPYAVALKEFGYPSEALTIIKPYSALILKNNDFDDSTELALIYKEDVEENEAFRIFLGLLKKEKNKRNQSWLLIEIGDIYATQGNLTQALAYFEKNLKISKELYAKNENNVEVKRGLGVVLERIGDIYTTQGNLTQALMYFEEYLKINKELYADNKNNVEIKRGLGIAYSKLGDIYTTQGNLTQALAYFEESLKIDKELYAENQNNVEIKRGLGIGLERVGTIYIIQGNLPQALAYFEENLKISKELYAENKNNVEIKRDLEIAHSRVGDIYTTQENLIEALVYFEESLKISKELYAENKNNVKIKRGLGIAYSKLGDIYTTNKDFMQALKYFIEANLISMPLCEENPNDYNNFWLLASVKERLGNTSSQLYTEDTSIAKAHYLAAQNAWNTVYEMTNLEKFKDWAEGVKEKIKAL